MYDIYKIFICEIILKIVYLQKSKTMELSLYYIDLSKYSLKSIRQISEFNTLEDIDLYSLKKKGHNRVWINVRDINIIATSKIKKNKNEAISLTRTFHDKIVSMNLAKMDTSYYEKSNKVTRIFKFDLNTDLVLAKSICEKYNLSYETLLHNKNKKIRKVWLSDSGEGIVYYESAGWESLVSSYFIEDLKKCTEWELNIPSDIAIDKDSIIFDVDIILDKILVYGINVLTKEELQFLDNQ